MPTVKHNGNSFEVDENGFMPDGPDVVTDAWIDYQCSRLGLESMTEEHYIVVGKLWQWHIKAEGEPLCIRLIQKNMGIKLREIHQLFPEGPKGLSLMANVKFIGVVYQKK